MKSFGAKRKVRKIHVQDEDEETAEKGSSLAGGDTSKEDVTSDTAAPLKLSKRQFKQSSLRKSINYEDVELSKGASAVPIASSMATDDDNDDEGGPAVIRPSISRSGSTKSKKRFSSSSRLSFGATEPGAEGGDGAVVTPKKSSLANRALENSAFKKGTPLRSLPTRALGGGDDRPTYSKEYLQELQSSTPNTPQNLSSLKITDDDEDDGYGDISASNNNNNSSGVTDSAMELDASELEGAQIVRTSDLPRPARIPTEAEIREKKERRARLAHEQEYIGLSSGSEDERRQQVLLPRAPRAKDDTRLAEPDEDLGEGYDEFVSDGAVALGAGAERAARRRRRADMAEAIARAGEEEGGDGDGYGDGSDDGSEAERLALYEAAQTRAGLGREEGVPGDDEAAVGFVPRMRPLPELDECLRHLRDTVAAMQGEVEGRRAKIAGLRREKDEILAREREVQEVLDRTGEKYQAAMPDVDPRLAAQSPLRMAQGIADTPVERGLESFGTTPVVERDVEDMV